MTRLNYLLIAASILFCVIPAFAEKPDLPTQNAVPVFANFGAKSIATPTILLTPGVKTDIGARLPAGTIGFTFDVWDGDILTGHEDNLATASSKWVGYRIASGSIGVKWDNLAGKTCHLWAVPNGTATVTVILGLAFGNWED